MNVLVYRYGSICEPDIMVAFEELGFGVATIEDEIYNKKITGKEQIQIISQKLQEGNYQFVFTINFFPAISEVCNLYHIPYLCIIVDSPVMELYSDSIANEWNRIFLFDKALYNEFASYNPNGIFHLPLATNVKRWDAVIWKATEADLKKYAAEVSFIGSLYSEKCPYNELKFPNPYMKGYIEGLMNAQRKVYGYFFLEEVLQDDLVEAIVSQTSNFYQFPERARKNNKAALAQFYLGPKITEMERVELLTTLGKQFKVDLYSGSNALSLPVNLHGRVKTHTEMPLVFHESQINLNMTAKSIRSGIPQRVWDVLGCGGFLISNYQAELPEFLVPNEDFVFYSSKEELVELVDYYLANPRLCREIADNAYRKVKEYHTWTVRLTQMIELAFFRD